MNDLPITHVERLNTFQKLAVEGFEGTDANLRVSLEEYFLAWKKVGDEYLFIYNLGNNHYDRVTMKADLDVYKEFNWIKKDDWEKFYDSFDTTDARFYNLPLPRKIADLLLHYGRLNIFGESYWEGFEIK